MAVAPSNSGAEFLSATKEVSKEVTKKSWVAGLMINMVGIRGKMDLDNIDPATGQVTIGTNAGLSANDIVNNSIAEISRMQDEYDPETKSAKAKMQARSPWNLTGGDTVDTLKSRDPAKAEDIENAAVDGLVDNFLGSTHDYNQENTFITGLGNKIDANIATRAREKTILEINKRVADITSKYEKGEIASIDELIIIRDQTINPELKNSIDAKIQQYTHSRDIYTGNTGGDLTRRVISQSLTSMSPPLVDIYRNIINQAETQLTNASATTLAEIAAQRAELEATNPNNIEITLNYIKNIVKYGGPALMVALLCTGAGAGIGAIPALGGSALIGAGIGGSVGALAGGIKWTFSGGYKEWRKIGASAARSQAELAKFEERAGELNMKDSLKKLDFVDLLTEAATRGEAVSRGLRTEDQFKSLRNEIGSYTGSGVNRAALDASIKNIFNTQFKPVKP